jgi:hypothetical protein
MIKRDTLLILILSLLAYIFGGFVALKFILLMLAIFISIGVGIWLGGIIAYTIIYKDFKEALDTFKPSVLIKELNKED